MFAGCAFAVSGVGAGLVLTGLDSPLRAPFALFFLLWTPAAAVSSLLTGVEPAGRFVTSSAAAVAVNLLVAQSTAASHLWSARGGVVAVAALSALIALPALIRPLRRRIRSSGSTQ
ncbi:hypothetical protein [Streptomyces sp. NPDC050504]|uniref:hypothetical protein n=1 Tax=Streptomyces sp. NPDC050504 TaxID=3365618 RepID=UPI00379F51F3